MSYIGSKPIKIPPATEVNINGNLISISGPRGKLERQFNKALIISVDEDNFIHLQKPAEKELKPIWGTSRALLANMLKGVNNGFLVALELRGIGYKAEFDGEKTLTLHLGFSHTIDVIIPEVITSLDVLNRGTLIIINGLDKERINSFAANIRDLRRPEPYKGKGIRYLDENVREKEGKKK